jgi:hypothetical protein
MMEFIRFTFSGFWYFVGMAILLNGAAYFFFNTVFRMYNRWVRHRNIKAAGWPPNHLDADGDFKEESK